jgi:hypothetical protein
MPSTRLYELYSSYALYGWYTRVDGYSPSPANACRTLLRRFAPVNTTHSSERRRV